MTTKTTKPGWFWNQVELCKKEVKKWPKWMKS